MIIKKQAIQVFLLSLVFATIFYYVRDIEDVIKHNVDETLGGDGVSDLSRYLGYYNSGSINSITEMGLFNNSLYHWVMFFLKNIGIKFELCVFILILSYYICFAKLSNVFIGIKKWYVISFVFCILSFWLIPLGSVAIRQGLAILTIAAFWPFLEQRKSFFLEILLVLIIANIHSTALSLFPLIIFKRIFNGRLLLLDFILFTALVLYIFNFWAFAVNQILSTLDYLKIESRSFTNPDTRYIVGFSAYKAIAFIIPAILYRVPAYLNYQRFKDLEGMYIFYVYYGLLAMLLSGLPYHDRVFLYAWAFSPILITTFAIYLLPLKTKQKY